MNNGGFEYFAQRAEEAVWSRILAEDVGLRFWDRDNYSFLLGNEEVRHMKRGDIYILQWWVMIFLEK